jgi:uncharacterized membrane protein YoaK (UPF0700 family)
MSSPHASAAAIHQPAVTSLRHPLAQTLLLLTFTAGLIDAVSYLGIGHVFTANMTGNIVFLGFGIAGGSGLPVLAPLISLAAFLVGAGGGGMLASRMADRRPQHLARALSIETLLVGAAAVVAAAVDVHANGPSGDVVIALLAVSMGARNATVRKLAVPDLTTTVLTMTLTGLAADSRLFGGSGKGSTRRVAAVLAMFIGALTGALLQKTSLFLPLAVATSLACLAWLAYPRADRPSR